MPKSIQYKDISGQKFGRLIAISSYPTRKYYRQGKKIRFIRMWICKCSCGQKITKPTHYLKSGDTKSCGCLRKDMMTIHGLSTSRFRNIWDKILDRCNNTKSKGFKYYGGRGIECLWKSFEIFKDDMYESYLKHVERFGEKQTSIERINNDGNYCRKNCRWATWKEQVKNKRSKGTAL